jgi:hypothetical protein
LKKMKKVLFFSLFLFFYGAAGVKAQVTIGKNEAPHPGSVLDLRSADKGLLLPRVNISDANNFQLWADKEDEAIGMLVYNINAAMTDGQGAGIYVWNGSKWVFAAISGGAAVPVTTISVGSEGSVTDITAPNSLQLTASVLPAYATNGNVTWSVYSETTDYIATVDRNGLVTPTNNGSGTVVVRATSEADAGKFGSITLNITTGTGPGTVAGRNGIYKTYCYPEGIGCWMIENSKEPPYTYTTFPGHVEGWRGYYYSWDQASLPTLNQPCPMGWVVADTAAWGKLVRAMTGAGRGSLTSEHWASGTWDSGSWVRDDQGKEYPKVTLSGDQSFWALAEVPMVAVSYYSSWPNGQFYYNMDVRGVSSQVWLLPIRCYKPN